MITAGSFIGSGNDQETNAQGVPYAHAFSILRTLTLSNGVDLVVLRNPWGIEKFNGTWSDSDYESWTEELREEAKVAVEEWENDGKFFMSFEDYLKNMQYTTFSVNVS